MDISLIRPSARQFIFTPSPIARTTIGFEYRYPDYPGEGYNLFLYARTLPLLQNTSLFKSLVYSGYSGRFSNLHVRLKAAQEPTYFPWKTISDPPGYSGFYIRALLDRKRIITRLLYRTRSGL